MVQASAAILPFSAGSDLSINTAAVVNDSGVSDHHAITPTMSVTTADLPSLPSGEKDILFMIAARLICAVGDRHIYNETTVTMDCESHIFKAKSKNVLKDGWKAVEQAYKSALKNKADEDDEPAAAYRRSND